MLKTLKSATTTNRSAQIPAATVGKILLGKRAVSADTDLRLVRYFGMSDGFFLRIQMDDDLRVERRALEKKLQAIRPRAARTGPHLLYFNVIPAQAGKGLKFGTCRKPNPGLHRGGGVRETKAPSC